MVKENAKNLVLIGAKVDFKALLNDLNSDESSLQDLFSIAQQVGVRQLYLRPTILNGQAYDFSSAIPMINTLSKQYKMPVKFNLTKSLARNYTRCHQMYQFPVFCADGEIYTCCDNKGNSKFSLGKWDEDDFRDLWLGPKHHDIYNSTDTRFCPHCRPNSHNISIQNIINDNSKMEQLYT